MADITIDHGEREGVKNEDRDMETLQEDSQDMVTLKEDSQGSNYSSSDHTSDANRDGSESPPSDTAKTDLPNAASLWKRRHLQHLKITIDESEFHLSDPEKIVGLLTEYKPTQDHEIWTGHDSDLKQYVAKLKKSIEKTKAYGRSMDTSFRDLTMEKGIIDMLATENDMWDIVHNPEDQPKIKQFKNLYGGAGKEFTERLIRCIYLKDKDETVSEHMYQHLFISFLQLFNMRCHFDPCLPESSMQICGQVIKGKPDVSIELLEFYRMGQIPKPVVNWKFLAVCEVKRDFVREQQPPRKKTRFCTPDDFVNETNVVPFIPDNILGQHGAELLLHYPSSVRDDCIIGMIIEQTHVTFVALMITKEQYEQMKNGKLKGNKKEGPKLFLTKSYDYLVWNDRVCLTQALLTLGYLQNYGSDFFKK